MSRLKEERFILVHVSEALVHVHSTGSREEMAWQEGLGLKKAVTSWQPQRKEEPGREMLHPGHVASEGLFPPDPASLPS